MCSSSLAFSWVPLKIAPPEAPELRRVRDDKYRVPEHTREFWFSGADGQYMLCVLHGGMPVWFTFAPAGNGWSVAEEEITTY